MYIREESLDDLLYRGLGGYTEYLIHIRRRMSQVRFRSIIWNDIQEYEFVNYPVVRLKKDRFYKNYCIRFRYNK